MKRAFLLVLFFVFTASVAVDASDADCHNDPTCSTCICRVPSVVPPLVQAVPSIPAPTMTVAMEGAPISTQPFVQSVFRPPKVIA
jgi:hypothetical protein